MNSKTIALQTVQAGEVRLIDLSSTKVRITLGSCICVAYVNSKNIIASHIFNHKQSLEFFIESEKLKRSLPGEWKLLGIFGGNDVLLGENKHRSSLLETIKEVPIYDIKKTIGFPQTLHIFLKNDKVIVEVIEHIRNTS